MKHNNRNTLDLGWRAVNIVCDTQGAYCKYSIRNPSPIETPPFFNLIYWLIAWTSGNTLLQVFLTLWHAQNRPNKCNNLELHESVFGFKEGGLKLDVTTWVPRFMQSVISMSQCSWFWRNDETCYPTLYQVYFKIWFGQKLNPPTHLCFLRNGGTVLYKTVQFLP